MMEISRILYGLMTGKDIVMEHNDTQVNNSRAGEYIRNVCSEYGMHGNIFYYQPCSLTESDRNRVFIVAGDSPDLHSANMPSWVNPERILRRAEQNNKLFYPKIWAFDLSGPGNEMKATEELVEYLKIAEFVKNIYAQYGLEPPEKLRVSEVSQLIDFHDMANNPNFNEKIRSKCEKDLKWFFKREKSKGIRRKWLEYFRSEHFPDDKGPIAKLLGYFRQNQQRTSIKQLTEVTEDVHKLEMQEHEYKLFTRLLGKLYPDVMYAADDKEIVNHGGVNNPRDTHEALGRRVTGEEYAVIRRDRFAEEGWDALKDLKEAYWEFRDVYFKACDEPLIAAVYNSIRLQYAKCDPLAELHEPVHMIDVSVTDFMNFVSLAKANNLHFYIDNGDFGTPSLETVHVIYSEYQSEKLRGILDRMMNDKVKFSHVLEGTSHPALSHMIQDMEHLRQSNNKPEHIIPSRREQR